MDTSATFFFANYVPPETKQVCYWIGALEDYVPIYPVYIITSNPVLVFCPGKFIIKSIRSNDYADCLMASWFGKKLPIIQIKLCLMLPRGVIYADLQPLTSATSYSLFENTFFIFLLFWKFSLSNRISLVNEGYTNCFKPISNTPNILALYECIDTEAIFYAKYHSIDTFYSP